ncbi:phosphate butyryltransferase [Planococcus sp. N028]|uniref:Phosphate butyryltransferase n=1 Tax=Planococcus shixiaomingii TaxID=3058393 RepID=A0ABT8MXY9_9BACL|nr:MULTISPECIES: phosphate butyryltransferase [unclassified Planococcus (in: firmicutes)]MDN7240511.1 phosphate butyryltransferase [Planococcus sp. N028]WKA56406.1 phosphate butyryltransferase [Planococcus sp. N022]
MTTLTDLIESIAVTEANTVAVAAAADREVMEAISLAIGRGMASFRLYDDESKLKELIHSDFPHLVGHPKIQLFHVKGAAQAAKEAVKSVYMNDSNVLMKGHIPTAVLMKAVLNPEFGLRTGSVLSHVAAFEIEGFERLIFITDAGMNISPDLQQKAQIIQNAVQIARAVGVDLPIVAPLAAVEVINPNMQATLDAAALTAMNRRGQIKDCIVDGPLALDNAISLEAAKNKGLMGDTAGRADILLVPNIESGNILYKSLVYFSNAKVGGVIAGAKAPIVLTSRADSAESKLFSLALAICSSTI